MALRDRFHQRRRAVNVAPAIVSLQRQAEEIRANELKRMQAKLGTLNAEQLAAVEALTRGLVNKFLHPPMQALKQAARENDSIRVEALCETWSLPSSTEPEEKSQNSVIPIAQPENKTSINSPRESETSAVGGK